MLATPSAEGHPGEFQGAPLSLGKGPFRHAAQLHLENMEDSWENMHIRLGGKIIISTVSDPAEIQFLKKSLK